MEEVLYNSGSNVVQHEMRNDGPAVCHLGQENVGPVPQLRDYYSKN